jgi:hypothetical protein
LRGQDLDDQNRLQIPNFLFRLKKSLTLIGYYCIINDRIPDQRKEGFDMLERRELKGLDTTYLSMKVPNLLYEFFRTKAFEQKKTVSLVIQEVLEDYKRREVG